MDADDFGGAHFARLERLLGACKCDTGIPGPCPLTGWMDLGPVPGSPDLRVFRHDVTRDWITVSADGEVVTGSAFLSLT